MTIIKKLRQIIAELSLEESNPYNTQGRKVLNETYQYLISGTYTTIKHKEIILKSLDRSPKEIAHHFKVSEQALIKARQRILKDFQDKLGSSFFTLLEKRQWEEAARYLQIAQRPNIISDVLISDMIQLLNNIPPSLIQKGDAEVKLSECEREISFLRTYTWRALKSFLTNNDLEQQRLFYLILLLDGQIGTTSDRYKLIKILTSVKA